MKSSYKFWWILSVIAFCVLIFISLNIRYEYKTLSHQGKPFAPSILISSGWNFTNSNSTNLNKPCNSLTAKDTTSGKGFPFIYTQTQTGCNGATINSAINWLAIIYNVLIAAVVSSASLLPVMLSKSIKRSNKK